MGKSVSAMEESPELGTTMSNSDAENTQQTLWKKNRKDKNTENPENCSPTQVYRVINPSLSQRLFRALCLHYQVFTTTPNARSILTPLPKLLLHLENSVKSLSQEIVVLYLPAHCMPKGEVRHSPSSTGRKQDHAQLLYLPAGNMTMAQMWVQNQAWLLS